MKIDIQEEEKIRKNRRERKKEERGKHIERGKKKRQNQKQRRERERTRTREFKKLLQNVDFQASSLNFSVMQYNFPRDFRIPQNSQVIPRNGRKWQQNSDM